MGVLLGSVGCVVLIFGLFAVFIAASPLVVYLHVGAGVVLLGLAALRSWSALPEILGSEPRRAGLNVMVQTLLLCTSAGLLAFLSVRHPLHWDLTEAQVHTLTRGTQTVLDQIPEGGVTIYAFFTSGGEEAAKPQLDQYAYASERVSLHFFDPNRRPDLAARFDIRSDGVVIVCSGACETATGTVRISEVSEEQITRAIRGAISSTKKVYFVTGHGEASPFDEEVDGFSRIRVSLEDENIEALEVLLANEPEVPTDADAVVIAGPTHSLFERELSLLDTYLLGGGRLLVLADPLVQSNLEETLSSWGVELGDDIVVEEQLQLFAGPQLGVQPVVTRYGSHPITDELGSEPTIFTLARSVRAADESDGVVELATTGATSWAETDIDAFVDRREVHLDADVDRSGPIALAAARTFDVEGEAAEGRLVVIGDADFARNRYVAEFFNADFFLNTINWLVGEENFITIDRKLPRASSVSMTREAFANLRFALLFLLPEAILVAGILGWWRRRT